ncbi:MAG: tetratricopeptide repeat protein [Roseibacillus sp.]|nr:tetratricopeptide repeat protein [Roseibacillus sp.]
MRDAEKAEKDGKFLEAFNRYDKARQLFASVALSNPEFKPDLVRNRREATTQSMSTIREKALAERNKIARRTGDLVEGNNAPPRTGDLSIPQLSKEDQNKVAALQMQIAQYRNELQKSRSDRDANAVRLREALRQLETERDRVARAPVSGQLNDLNQRIRKVEDERDTMFKALRDSRAEHQRVLAELAVVKADAAASQKRATELEEVVNVQQSAAREVVEGLRRQLKELKDSLVEKDRNYTALEARTAQLGKQLGEARDEIRDLRDERDDLLIQRDQMAALLKLNESERVQLLIKQNMDLGRDLKIARDRLKELHTDNNTTKDQLIEAKRDLAQAKGRLIDFQRENASQKSRLEAMENRLRAAGTELKEDLQTAKIDPRSREEMEMLRDIISRQLRIQEHRRNAKEAVMAEIRKIGQQQGPLIENIQGLFEQELRLTAEESRLIAEFKIDDDFIFEDRPQEHEVANAARSLQQSISIKDQLARRAFSNGRFLAAREVFESILDQHPGHVETMLNLGVVHVKNEDIPLAISSFNDALVIRGDNLPFAHFMLGVCHYRVSDLENSKMSLQRAVDLDNGNAKAFVFLGNVAGREERDDQAEAHFKTAIQIDPTLSDPYYNLAVIYLRKGMKEEALKYYQEALKRGADPNLEFEASLALN